MNAWGKESKHQEYGNKLKFLNRTNEKYDWDNDELNDDEGLDEEDPAHPNLPAEISGADLESECMNHGSPIQEEVVDIMRAATARANANLSGITEVDFTNKEEAEHKAAVDAVVVEDVDKNEEEEKTTIMICHE